MITRNLQPISHHITVTMNAYHTFVDSNSSKNCFHNNRVLHPLLSNSFNVNCSYQLLLSACNIDKQDIKFSQQYLSIFSNKRKYSNRAIT